MGIDLFLGGSKRLPGSKHERAQTDHCHFHLAITNEKYGIDNVLYQRWFIFRSGGWSKTDKVKILIMGIKQWLVGPLDLGPRKRDLTWVWGRDMVHKIQQIYCVCVCVEAGKWRGDSEGSQLGHDLLLRLGESLFRNIWLQRLKHENIHYSTNLEQEKDTKRTPGRGALSSVAIVEWKQESKSVLILFGM